MAATQPTGARFLMLLALAPACGPVTNLADAGPGGDAAVDAAVDAADLRPRVVFVTSTATIGSMPPLGGLAGADAICQARAAAVDLPGRFMAWLAVNNANPASRMTRSAGPYRLTTGLIVAQGWSDLTDGNLASSVNRTESGAMSQGTFVCRGGEVWSNVDGAGNLRVGQGNCLDWSSTTADGTAGNVMNRDIMWTAGDCAQIGCSSALPIYCIEQ
jgi:hypothetical protein